MVGDPSLLELFYTCSERGQGITHVFPNGNRVLINRTSGIDSELAYKVTKAINERGILQKGGVNPGYTISARGWRNKGRGSDRQGHANAYNAMFVTSGSK